MQNVRKIRQSRGYGRDLQLDKQSSDGHHKVITGLWLVRSQRIRGCTRFCGIVMTRKEAYDCSQLLLPDALKQG